MRPFERCVARNRQAHVCEAFRPAAAHSDLLDLQHPWHLYGLQYIVAHRGRHTVDECSHRASTELEADVDHDAGNHECGHGIGLRKPRDTEPRGQPYAGQAHDHYRRRPDIRREMQRIGFQGLAVIFPGGPVEDS